MTTPSYYEHGKAKTAPKQMISDKILINQKVLRTAEEISKLVGSTLGPNGLTVLIERNEQGLPPIRTKDGVTVAKAMAYHDAVKQSILEVFRQAAQACVNEAGDGTTSTSVLAYAILREMQSYLKEFPQESAQSVLRRLQKKVQQDMVAVVKKKAINVSINDSEDLLRKVALVSTNHDVELSEAVLEAFKLVGENGYISITEDSGEAGYEVVKVKGFSSNKGFEDYIGHMSVEFINDSNNQQISLSNCKFLLIDGKLKDIQGIRHVLMVIEHFAQEQKKPVNLVLVAHGYTAEVLSKLSKIYKLDGFVKIFPAITELSMIPSSQYEYLKDVAAYSGAKIFSPLTDSFKNFKMEHLGLTDGLHFECGRYRSVIYGEGSERTIIERVNEIESRLPKESKAVQLRLHEKIGKLTGGVAKIIIKGYSDAQIRECKDRAEDAVCSLRASLKSGIVPGGCRLLIDMASMCSGDSDPAVSKILGTAFLEPFMVLLNNGGLRADEINAIYEALLSDASLVYDVRQHMLVHPSDNWVYDSADAVSSAIRTSIEIATGLSSIGGLICYMRDDEVDQEMYGREIQAEQDMK